MNEVSGVKILVGILVWNRRRNDPISTCGCLAGLAGNALTSKTDRTVTPITSPQWLPGHSTLGAINTQGKLMSNLKLDPPVRHPIWPAAVVIFGFSLSAVWVGLLGYGLIKLVEYAI